MKAVESLQTSDPAPRCDEVRRSLSARHDGELSRLSVARQDCDRHLESCEECRTYERGLQTTSQLFANWREAPRGEVRLALLERAQRAPARTDWHANARQLVRLCAGVAGFLSVVGLMRFTRPAGTESAPDAHFYDLLTGTAVADVRAELETLPSAHLWAHLRATAPEENPR